MIVCLFGFFRNSKDYTHNIKDKVYVFTPSIQNEDNNEKITYELITSKYKNVIAHIYEYDKHIHIDKAQKLFIPRFNEFYQQPYRIFSFFYHIKMY
jgi:hypothetical protein